MHARIGVKGQCLAYRPPNRHLPPAELPSGYSPRYPRVTSSEPHLLHPSTIHRLKG